MGHYSCQSSHMTAMSICTSAQFTLHLCKLPEPRSSAYLCVRRGGGHWSLSYGLYAALLQHLMR